MNPILFSKGKRVLNDGPLFALLFFIPSILFSIHTHAQSTTWNGTSWTNVLNGSSDVIIASSTSPGAFTCKNVTIARGYTLTLSGGVTATIHGTLINDGNGTAGVGTLRFESGGAQALSGNAFTHYGVIEVSTGTTLTTNGLLTIGDGGSLLHGSNTPNGGGTVSGTITFEKTIGSTSTGWRLFALPVAALVDDFENGLNTLCNNHSPTGERNVYYWDAADGSRAPLGGYYAMGWTQADAGSDNENKAYTIYLDNSGSGLFDFSSTVSISGTPNDSTKTFSLGNTFDPPTAANSTDQQGWNLIPNYFPSNLSVYSLITDVGFGTSYKAIHIWDQGTGQMIGLNQSGMNSYNNSSVSAYGAIRQIPPFMGFWVKATAQGQSIQLKNSMRTGRVDSMPAATYFKKEFDIFRVTVEDADGNQDQFSVCFDEAATEGTDPALDIYKFRSLSAVVPTLYTRVEGAMMALNVLPLKEAYTMPLFMESLADGKTYTFRPETAEYSNTFDVELVDNKTGIKTPLLDKTYTFKHDATYTGARFTLNFTQKTATGIDEPYSLERSWAFTNENGIGVTYSNPNSTATARVEIYSILGQKLFTSGLLHGGETVTYQPAGNSRGGIYIAHIISNGRVKTIKVMY